MQPVQNSIERLIMKRSQQLKKRYVCSSISGLVCVCVLIQTECKATKVHNCY